MKVQCFAQAQLWHPRHKMAALVSGGIRSATSGDFSHVGFLFTLSDADILKLSLDVPSQTIARLEAIDKAPDGLCRALFEFISTENKRTHKSGVTGPLAWSERTAWHSAGAYWRKGKKRYTRRLELADLPLSEAQTREALIIACNATEQIKYAHLQIIRNWLGYRLGRGVPLRRRSRTKWTCCEFVARVLCLVDPRFCLALNIGDVLYDEIAPSSRSGRAPGLWEMIGASGCATKE